jgi:hypothetical protein
VNTSFRLALWADCLYGCDATWWNRYFPELSTCFHGEMWTVSTAARDRYGLSWIYGQDRNGLSREATSIHTGKNSGYQAISLAYLFGAKRILLLGFDFQRTGGKSHWHGDHPRGLGNGGRFPIWATAMATLARDLEGAGVEVVNCSRQTALRCFRRSTIQEELCDQPALDIPMCSTRSALSQIA